MTGYTSQYVEGMKMPGRKTVGLTYRMHFRSEWFFLPGSWSFHDTEHFQQNFDSRQSLTVPENGTSPTSATLIFLLQPYDILIHIVLLRNTSPME